MLSTSSRPVIEATLPVVAQRIPTITTDFYRRLFEAHPTLLDGTFSRANQANGQQQQALAGSIATFATHLLDHPDTLPEEVLQRIAHKHASLHITEDQYQVVYDHLFAAIAADLGEAVTAEVAEAWSEVYWLMAESLMKIEQELANRAPEARRWTSWVVTATAPAGPHAVTVDLAPAPGVEGIGGLPGQYVSVRTALADGLRQARQYTLSRAAHRADARTITVKRDPGGEVSGIVASLPVGATVELSQPCGDVVLDEADGPVVFATAGIGCTPAAAMLDELVRQRSARPVTVLHAEPTVDDWALADQVLTAAAALPHSAVHLWVEQDQDRAAAQLPATVTAHPGLIDLTGVTIDPDSTVYLCGPLGFMRSARRQLIEAGVAPRQIRYEVFGPDVWFGQDDLSAEG